MKTDHFSKPAVLQRYSKCMDVWQDNGSGLRQKLLPSEVGQISFFSLSVCRSSVRASNLQTLLMVIIKVWQMSPISGCFTVYWLITSHMQHTVRRYGCLDICGDVSFEFLIYSSMKLSKRNWKDCDYMFLQGIFRTDVRVISVGCYNADASTLLSRLSQSLMSRAVCAA